MAFQQGLTLGIDLGIGSCGWAIIRNNGHAAQILDWGVRTFNVPETAKKRTPTNQLRREHRGLRRVLRRRRQRMDEIRRLFKVSCLLESDGKFALNAPGLDPWRLRAEGLDRRLSGKELAVALGHIAKHRGFKSNSKRKSNDTSDDSKMLKAVHETAGKLAAYRTVGEMFAKDEDFANRKRNRDGDYSRSVLRDDQEREVKLLFSQQRRAGNTLATEELENAFIEVAFFQRPLADSEDRVGWCPFVTNKKRAAKRSPSFERFRFVARLTTLRLQSSSVERALSPEEIAAACVDFGKQNGMTFKRLRKLLSLDDNLRFSGIPIDDENKRDVVNRSSGNGCMQGTRALRDILGDAGWNTFRDTPETLDKIAFVLTFREDINSIRKGLDEIGLTPIILEALMIGVERGAFSDFKGAGNISPDACQKILPHLMRGLAYSDACKCAGYDHSQRPETKLDQIANPIARKALTEAIKQVRTIIHEYGLPERIHVELARDIGKSKEEREEIRSGIERRNKARDRLYVEFHEVVGSLPRGEDILRYELWKEQRSRCLYCDRPIHPNAIVSSDNTLQVDHILPWSRSGDDSFVNKSLCHAGCNQEKKGSTPFEWLGSDLARWETFETCVESIKEMKGRKKRNYLLKNAKLLEEKFRPRNLGDTRYATRLLLDELARWYPNDGKVHVYARPGRLTNLLRKGWGIQDLKKTMEPDGEKRRADDRHHALDALIVAATSQSALATLTKAFQDEECRGGHRNFANLTQPWPGFVSELREKFDNIFISRAEGHRARGEGHAATIRSVAERNGETAIFERKGLQSLSGKDVSRIRDPDRNAKLIENIRKWIADGKPKGTWPKSPKGDDVRKVSLLTNKKLDVLIRGGAAERGEMVRVDMFRKKNKKAAWEFFLVPIYPHQVADVEKWPLPPNKAIQANSDEALWPEMNDGYEFCWSLYPLSLVEIIKPDGEVIEGYFRGVSRSTGALTVSPHFSKQETRTGIGTRTLSQFRKFHVDRLGRKFCIERETRTWHGAACI